MCLCGGCSFLSLKQDRWAITSVINQFNMPPPGPPQPCWGPIAKIYPFIPPLNISPLSSTSLHLLLSVSPFAFPLRDCIINSGSGLSRRQMFSPCQGGEYDFKRTDRRHFQSLSVIRSGAAHGPRGLMRRRRCAVLLGVPLNSAPWRWIWNRGLRRDHLMAD